MERKIAIVTGASSGMGREMVYLLADHFAALEEIWVSRQDERTDLEELVGKVPVSVCGSCRFDLTSEEDLGAALRPFKAESSRTSRSW